MLEEKKKKKKKKSGGEGGGGGGETTVITDDERVDSRGNWRPTKWFLHVLSLPACLPAYLSVSPSPHAQANGITCKRQNRDGVTTIPKISTH